MDIWAWTEELQKRLHEAGEGRLAASIDMIPHYSYRNDHEALDALFPEARAAARRLELPWLEVHLGHWYLRSRIGRRMLARDSIGEAIALLEFAHRPETRECPQSICVTQDVVEAYQQSDHVGFVDERLEATAEALARITPSWQCFVCISEDRANTLIDAGRPAEALALVEVQIRRLLEEGGEHGPERVGLLDDPKGAALIALGRVDEGIAIFERVIKELREEGGYHNHRLHIIELECAHALARRNDAARNDAESALELLTELGEVERTPALYPRYVRAVEALIEAGVVENTWGTGAVLWRMARALFERGAARYAVDAALSCARLAADRNASGGVRRALRLVRRACESLRAPHPEAEAALSTLAEAAQAPAIEPWADLDELRERLGQDPERDFALLDAAVRRHAEDDTLWLMRASALEAVGEPEEAIEALREALDERATEARLHQLARALFEAGRGEEAAALAASQMEGDLRRSALHIEAHAALNEEAWERAASATSALREEYADDARGWGVGAVVARAAGRWDEVLALTGEAIERFHPDEPSDADWLRMVAGSITGDWAAVRDSAARIGYKFESSEGPIDEPFAFCRILDPSDASAPAYMAHRIGPVSARVIEFAMPDRANRYGEVVVFDPDALNEPPEDPEEAEHFVPHFHALHTLSPPTMRSSLALHGALQSEEQLDALRARLEARGLPTERVTGPDYQVWDEEEGQEIPGVYLLFGVPHEMELSEAHAIVSAETAGEPTPFQWTALAAQAGDDEAASAHATRDAQMRRQGPWAHTSDAEA